MTSLGRNLRNLYILAINRVCSNINNYTVRLKCYSRRGAKHRQIGAQIFVVRIELICQRLGFTGISASRIFFIDLPQNILGRNINSLQAINNDITDLDVCAERSCFFQHICIQRTSQIITSNRTVLFAKIVSRLSRVVGSIFYMLYTKVCDQLTDYIVSNKFCFQRNCMGLNIDARSCNGHIERMERICIVLIIHF